MQASKSKGLLNYIKKGGFYKSVVEDGSDIIFIVDYDGKILYHNNSAFEVLGYRAKSLIGKNFFSFIAVTDLELFRKKFNASQRKTYTEKIEFQFLCKDNTYRYLEFNSINLKQKENLNGLILDCRDITQRKKDAVELVRLQKAKELFLANISHEIRTPINGIAGMASLLKLEQNPEERQTYLNAIKTSADNLKVIINDILDLASIESGKLKFEKVPFNLVDVLPSIVNTFKYQAKEKRISIEFAMDDKSNRILVGDPVRLNQMLINLVGNAVKFTHNGSVLVNCSVVKELKGTTWVEISVKDTGVGIPEEKLVTIFDSFSQADESITRKFGGTGLGLTIVKQLVELQKGTITVQSKENIGSVFTLRIPYTNGKAAPRKKSGARDKSTVEIKTSFERLHLLLVEDNDINRLYAQSILRNWNCTADIAENGLVAIERVKNKIYDVVLMDIQMPVMDGYEATKAIRAMHAPVNKIPIIALTANATKNDVDKCLKAGMNDYLAKPFTPEDLFRKLFDDLKLKANKEESLFDLNYLKKVSGNNQDFIKEMIQTFIKTLPPILEDIQIALVKSDWVKAAKIVHQVKPSLTLMGIHALKEPAAFIEEELKKINTSKKRIKPTKEVLTSLKRFIASLDKTRAELETLMESL
jgi:PAS domain S-box-containing protein